MKIPVFRGGEDDHSVPLTANYYLVQSTLSQQKAMEDSSGGYWMQLFATELEDRDNKAKIVQSIVAKVNRLLCEKMAKTEEVTFLQQPLDGGTLHEDINFIDEAIHFEGT